MRILLRAAFLIVTALYVGISSAQTVDERKLAAQRWLAKETIKIDYFGAQYSNRFTLDVKAKEVTFHGSPDRFCAGRPVPAQYEVTEDGMLAFLFDPKRLGCAQLRYTFDPITKAGVITTREATSDPAFPWTPSKSKITLVE